MTPAAAAVKTRRASAADEAWALMHQLMMAERRQFLTVAGELDLHPAQAGALVQMDPEVPMPMHELAASLRCDNSNVTGIVDRLEARGLVQRRPYEGDRRVRQVVLTPLGAAARDRIRGRMSTAPESLRRLSAADQRTLRDVLRRALVGD